MKYIIMGSIMFLSLFNIAAAQIRVSGHLIGGGEQSVKLVLGRYPTFFEQTSLDSQTDKNGDFVFQVSDIGEIKDGRLVFKTGGANRSVPIIVTGNVHVSIEADKVVYTADNMDFLGFLYQYEQHFLGATEKEFSYHDINPKEFVPLIDSLAKSRIGYINSFKNKLSDTSQLNRMYHEVYYQSLFVKLRNFIFYYQKNASEDKIDLEVLFKNYPPLINDDALVSDIYLLALYDYIGFIKEPVFNDLFRYNLYAAPNKAEVERGFNSNSFADYHIARLICSGNTKDYILARILYNNMMNYGVDDVAPIYEIFLQDCHDRDLKDIVSRKYNAIKKTAMGLSAPAFTLNDENGKSVSLQNFHGKIVFLDFWASWCAPCIADQIASAEIRKKILSRDDAVILNVSIDSSPAAWKNQLTLQRPEGINLIIGKNTTVKTDYGISAVPHYFVIGKDGEILSNNSSSMSPANIQDIFRYLK